MIRGTGCGGWTLPGWEDVAGSVDVVCTEGEDFFTLFENSAGSGVRRCSVPGYRILHCEDLDKRHTCCSGSRRQPAWIDIPIQRERKVCDKFRVLSESKVKLFCVP